MPVCRCVAAVIADAGPITVPSTLRLGGNSSTLCVQVNGTNSNSQKLVVAACTGSKTQPLTQSFISGTDPNTKRIQTASTTGSSYCMDVSGSGTSDGSAVIVYSCSTGKNQQWTKDAAGRWSPGHAPTMCLDAKGSSMTVGTQIVIRPCSTAASQKIAAVAI